MIINIILLLVLLVLIYKIINNSTIYDHMTSITKNNGLQYTNGKINLQIYQMLKDIDELFTSNNIEYWMDGGTLLGAVRHKGIIPWDDDADIEIDEKDVNKLLALESDLNNIGYELLKCWFGYKIFQKNGKQILGHKWKFPFVDIFITKNINGSHIFTSERAVEVFGSQCYLSDDELYPLKRYQFGEIYLNGPNNPVDYFVRYYGDDWNDITYKAYDHENEKSITKKKIQLTSDMRTPALPTGPLKNNI